MSIAEKKIDSFNGLSGHECPICKRRWIFEDCIEQEHCTGINIECPPCDSSKPAYNSKWFAYKEDPFIHWVREVRK